MKKNNILFGLISILCVGTAAGCGGESDPKYNITKIQPYDMS